MKPGTTHAWLSLQIARCSISWPQTGKEVKSGSVFEVMIAQGPDELSRLNWLKRHPAPMPPDWGGLKVVGEKLWNRSASPS